jgi:glycosyltransferase involved in cell wall biosynthesis
MNSASPKITALVHTRNESAWLAGCLETLQWADELIVADMTSTDDTREIATRFGARIIDMPLHPVVEPVRNLALSQCTHDWVLIVDADERVPASLAEHLRTLAKTSPASAIGLPRKNFFLGEWLEHGFWPDHQVRFVRRKQIDWPTLVHEPPKVDGQQINLEANPAWALEHPGYGASLSRFIQKFVHYSRLDAERQAATVKPAIWPYLIRRPASEFLGRYLGQQAWRHGMHGLVWSLLQATYQLLVACHYWDLQRSNQSVPPAETLRRETRNELGRTLLKWFRT